MLAGPPQPSRNTAKGDKTFGQARKPLRNRPRSRRGWPFSRNWMAFQSNALWCSRGLALVSLGSSAPPVTPGPPWASKNKNALSGIPYERRQAAPRSKSGTMCLTTFWGMTTVASRATHKTRWLSLFSWTPWFFGRAKPHNSKRGFSKTWTLGLGLRQFALQRLLLPKNRTDLTLQRLKKVVPNRPSKKKQKTVEDGLQKFI